MLSAIKHILDRRRAKRQAPKKMKSRGWWFSLVTAADSFAFSWPIRESLYVHLEGQVGNGVPVEKALDDFRPRLIRNNKPSSAKILHAVSRAMRDGKTLTDALRKWIPEEEATMIAAGEIAGDLPKALVLILETRRRTQRIREATRSALSSPLIYAAVLIGVLVFIAREVVPVFAQTLPRGRVTGQGKVLIESAEFINSIWALIPLGLVIVIAGLIWYSLPRWTGPWRIRAERYFPYSTYRDAQGFAWLMGFTAMLQAGVADVDVLDRQMSQTRSPWLRERLHALWWRMTNNSDLAQALLAKGRRGAPPFGFPNPDVVDNICSLAGFSDSPDRIAAVARRWADQMESDMLKRAKRWGLLMELLMYALIIFLVMAANDLSTQMGTSVGI